MRVLLVLFLALAGAGLGAGAGLFLRPAAGDGETDPTRDAEAGDASAAEADRDGSGPGMQPMPDRDRPPISQIDFVRMTNQFVVPLLSGGEVRALVVLSLGLEVRAGTRDVVFAREPKLRDALLQVMLDHANAGGFDGAFTAGPKMQALRRNLWEAVRPILGPDVFDVLITDIARQDT
jgi:hypothetical protein